MYVPFHLVEIFVRSAFAEFVYAGRDTGAGHIGRNAFHTGYIWTWDRRHELGLSYEDADLGDPRLRGRVRHANVFYTWAQTEQQRYRLGLRQSFYPGGETSTGIFGQLTYSLGWHTHPIN